jgi:hypothetical protein|tara:strand:- start:66 stop:443 length:378 start_codon:yes stop_codon:yes gene_type:complete
MACELIMASETSTYVLKNRYSSLFDEDLVFTEAQANLVLIKTTTKVYFNSVFNHWAFSVLDELGNTYSWKDFRCLEGADKAAVKTAIKNHLTNSVIKITEDTNNSGYLKTETSVADRGQDEYLGD